MFINSKLKIFIIVGVIFSSLYGFMVFQHRVPFAHDTFQYLQQQYVYFNEIAQGHYIPLWFPFVSQGSVGNYHFTPQINMLSPIFNLLGLFLKNVNYLYLFYFDLWFEELFFLLGIILLSSLYYKDIRTIFFVSITLLGTNIWYPQIWWNFHLYYFIPIMLYCIHKCLITRLFRYLIFSIVFFTLTVYGNFIYCGIFISFVIMLYLLFIIPVELNNAKSFFRKNMKPVKLAALLILISIIAASFYYIKYGADEIVFMRSGRTSSGETSLKVFLNHGGSIGLGKYREMIIKYGNSIDINLYAGFLLVPLVMTALLKSRKKISFAVGGVSLVLFLFSIGSFVSVFFYYLFPLGKIFRHIGLTATVFKLFIVLYAGFGFEIFLERIKTDKRLVYFILIYLISLSFLFIVKPYPINAGYFWHMTETGIMSIPVLISIVLIGNMALFWSMYKTKIKKEYLINLLLALMVIDFFSYKYSLIAARMPRVSAPVIGLFKPCKYDFLRTRLLNTKLYLKDNERMKLFYPFNDRVIRGYATYNTIESFFFTDSAVTTYQQDFMLKSIKKYFGIMREFPNSNRAYEKYSAVGYPKIGVFSYLNIVENETEIGRIFGRKDFTGDMLFTTAEDIKDKKKSLYPYLIHEQNHAGFLNQNERINADIQIERFSFNVLEVKVSLNGSPEEHCFLYYSDAYHPHWNAYVNGKKAVIIKSNIGYKSVMIPYGTSEVVFKFGNIIYYASISCAILSGLLILGSIGYIFIKEFVHKQIKYSEG